MNFMGMGLKLMGMGWGRVNFCWDGAEMGLMSTTVSLFNGIELLALTHGRLLPAQRRCFFTAG